MRPSSRKTSALAALGCLFGAAAAWSHVGPHPPAKPPPPLKVPALSPGTFGKGDPVPNRFDSTTGLSSGGIAYAWTVDAVGNFTAPLSGIVGASSWSDPVSLSAGEGWTRASAWVALSLRSPSRVTVRLSAKAGVPDPLGILPGETGGAELRPAFTLYSGWQETGPDETTYANGGDVPWAGALRYLGHTASPVTGAVTQSFELPAGLYTLALGGVHPGGFDPGRQGYEATVSILSRAAPATVLTKSRFAAKGKTYRLKGRFGNPGSAALLAVQQGKRTRFFPAKGGAWSVALAGLKPGRNDFYLTAVSKDGRVSPRKKVTIFRK